MEIRELQSGFREMPRYLTGIAAMVLSIYFLLVYRHSLSVVVASLFFILACATDTLKAKIPNLLVVCLILAGISTNSIASGWQGLLFSTEGFFLGFGLLLLPYMMGGFGAGDLKAVSALGALVGPADLLHVFVYMAFYGGGLAVLHYLFQNNIKHRIREIYVSAKASVVTRTIIRPEHNSKRSLRFPYAAAIAFGYYTFIIRGAVL